jgi:hypothetical protein
VCRGSFRLAAGDVGSLISLLSTIVSPAGAAGAPGDTGAQTEAETNAAAVPSPDQTGDVSMSSLPTVLVPRVA